MSFERIVNDIKTIKIQGAEAVAKAAAEAILLLAQRNKGARKDKLLKILSKGRDILLKTRPTEPCMRNVLNFLLNDLVLEHDVFDALLDRFDYVKRHFNEAKEKIALFGSRKIKNGMVVFTHCHSSSVVSVLLKAKEQGKEFEVFNTETRPLFQGRITAKELAKAGIKVTMFIDAAARIALKKADLMLIGADAITVEGKVINKIGSELFAVIADRYDVPVYSCTDSWKFDRGSIYGIPVEIENRSEKEIWPNKPRGVLIENPVFEKVDWKLITGVVSELGIHRPEILVEEVRRVYPWITKK